jgi:Na+-driven multidrug efflux pump
VSEPADNPATDPRYDPVTGRVVPTFIRYAIPSVLGMLAVTSAGIIDGFFIGNFVGPVALAAVNIATPAWAVFAAIVFMLAVGGSVMCGRFLGQQDKLAASGIFTRTMVAAVGFSLLITVPCLLFLDDVVRLLGANDILHPDVKTYMQIILWFAPLLVAGLTMDYFVRADGRPVLAASALLAFAGTNIALNALFIGYLGWGIAGAAWASALAEVVIFLVLITHWFSGRCSLQLSLERGRWIDVLKAAWNGLSEFTNELSIGLVVLLFNWVMITRQGVAGVAAYTIIAYLVMLGMQISYGVSESLQPTISRNLGAGQFGRIRRFFLTGLSTNFLVGLLLCTLLLAIPEHMVGVFLPPGERDTVAIALVFISFFWPAFLFNGMNITMASYFTALHRPVHSAAIALSRSLVLPALGLLLLPRWFGDNGVYLAIPVAELLTFLFAVVLVRSSRLRTGVS